MGIYTRYKKDPNGFRKLVELLEITPKDKREKMIEMGRAEDPEYTAKALAMTMNFQDILSMQDAEFAEVLSLIPPKIIAAAFAPLGKVIHDRVLKLAPRNRISDIRDIIEAEYRPTEVGGAQFKVIEMTRDLERRGKIQLKRIS